MAGEDSSTRVNLELEAGYRFRADFGAGFEPVFLDEPAPLGEGSGPNASAMLAAAVGNCLSASLLFCLRRAHLEVDQLDAEVEVNPLRNAKGRLRIGSLKVVLRPVVDSSSQGRLGRCLELFEDYCVVTDSVRHGIDVSVQVEPAIPGTPDEASPPDG